MKNNKKTPKEPRLKKAAGRPVLFKQELYVAICDRIAEGETLASILREKGMPGYRSFMKWQNNDNNSDIAREARESGYDIIAERTRETARGKGESSGDIQRDKLIIETDLKLLAKWSKKYSDKQSLDITGRMTLEQLVEASTKPKE